MSDTDLAQITITRAEYQRLEAERDQWRDKYLKLALNMRRKALGILGDIDVTPEQIVEWAEERKSV